MREKSSSGSIKTQTSKAPSVNSRTTTQREARTVFDLLYDQHLPFRLYTDFMLGSSIAELAERFALSRERVCERVEAMRLCLEKQVRLNLLACVTSAR
jgi:hypothetical protein